MMLNKKPKNINFRLFISKQRFTLKVIISSLLVLLVGTIFSVRLEDNMWSLVTVFVAMDTRLETTWQLSIHRIIGTFVGVTISALILHYFDLTNIWQLALAIIVLSFVGGQVYVLGKSVRVAGVAATVVLFMGLMHGNYWNIALERFLNICLGVICVLIVSWLILPTRSREELAKNLIKVTELFKSLTLELLLPEKNYNDNRIKRKLLEVSSIINDNNELVQELKLEYGRQIPRIAILIMLSEVIARLHMHLTAISDSLKVSKTKKVSAALKTELEFCYKQSLNVLEHLPKLFSNKIKPLPEDHKYFDTASIAIKNLDEAFMEYRSKNAGVKLNEQEILAYYTFLYHVKGFIKELALADRHCLRFANIYNPT